ncbi:MAG TPA: Type 1 glutamine amidotransferase-like domain-containing protein [bacterium]|nr:Type 1 glutamine amidotransferase-like domain-containing protein [bacterium]
MKDANLYLSGGGDSEDSFLLDKSFLEKIKKEENILYIPIAMETDTAGFESCHNWVTNTLSRASNTPIKIEMWTNLYNKSWNDIKDFGAIYIGGGNTFKLLNYLSDTGFISILEKYIVNGGIVYGGSAGAIIMGKSIKTAEDENDKEYKKSDGLNLLSGISIFCHYNSAFDLKIQKYIKENCGEVIALPEKTGLVVSDLEIVIIGYEPAYYFDLNGNITTLEINKKYSYDSSSGFYKFV